MQSEDEKGANTGVNATEYIMFEERNNIMDKRDFAELARRAPSAIDWIAEGKTLKPMEQGKCASCWAMATVSTLCPHVGR